MTEGNLNNNGCSLTVVTMTTGNGCKKSDNSPTYILGYEWISDVFAVHFLYRTVA